MQDLRRSPFARVLARQTQWFIVAGIALIIAGIFGMGSLMGRFSTAKANTATAETSPATKPGTFRPTDAQWESLKIVPVQLTSFQAEHTTEGKIANDDDTTTPVFSPYSGRVSKLFAKAGDYVKQDTPLLAVEASEFVQGQNDLISAVATLNTARVQLNLARTNEKRQHDLYDSKGGALKDWQQSQVDLATAEGGFRSGEIALAAVRNRLRILGKSDAEITAIENAPDRLNMNPEAIVYAPIAGTVTQRQVGLGQYINSAASGASNPVFSIGDMSKVWLLANVREADAPSMQLGQAIEVHILAFPARVSKAKLTYVAAAIDSNTHRLPVRAEVENPDGALKPEMFANFSIITGNAVTAPAVPEEAVIYEGQTARVWVAGKDKSLGLRQIRTDRTQDGMVEVLAGLQPGESVVTSGRQTAQSVPQPIAENMT
jgi:cobalt-zinc-cadmium efflux system membrane fusion protein